MPFERELSRRIKEKYEKYEDFAQAIGVTSSTVSHWIKRKIFPNEQNLVRICEILDWDYVEARRLIGEDRKKLEIESIPKELEELNDMLSSFPDNKRHILIQSFKQIVQAFAA
jgi:transcriptional regulator with XRE-family HTH domain